MTKPVKITLTDYQHADLHESLDRSRETSRTIKVPREALRAILRDHDASYTLLCDLRLIDRTS